MEFLQKLEDYTSEMKSTKVQTLSELCMRSEGYGTWSVHGTTGYEAANEWHQWLRNNDNMDNNVAKRLRSRDMA